MGRTARPTGRPVIPRIIEPDAHSTILRADGTETDAALIGLEDYDVGRIRDGYVCIQCLEDLDTSFPDQCPVCGFPMAARQAERYAKEYSGVIQAGPATTLEEERAIMQEMRMRKAREEGRIWTPTIRVPRDV